MAAIRNCKTCAQDFISTRAGHVYCSARCRFTANDGGLCEYPAITFTDEAKAVLRRSFGYIGQPLVGPY